MTISLFEIRLYACQLNTHLFQNFKLMHSESFVTLRVWHLEHSLIWDRVQLEFAFRIRIERARFDLITAGFFWGVVRILEWNWQLFFVCVYLHTEHKRCIYGYTNVRWFTRPTVTRKTGKIRLFLFWPCFWCSGFGLPRFVQRQLLYNL